MFIINFLSPILIFGQNVNIPDINFKALLVGNPKINSNGDNEIQLNEAIGLTGDLYCDYQKINDLTGVEAFANITRLICHNNKLKTLDVSKNLKLTTLDCQNNEINNLDLSNNLDLQTLYCNQNKLKTLDLKTCKNLQFLQCGGNDLSALDLSYNKALEKIHCDHLYDNDKGLVSISLPESKTIKSIVLSFNELKDLDVSIYPELEMLAIAHNEIKDIDVSKNPKLKYLSIESNMDYDDTTEFQLDVSQNPLLEKLFCNSTNIAKLDVRNNPLLVVLQCGTPGFYKRKRKLTSIDISNNPSLEILHCFGHDLTNLNLSKNQKISELDCSNNKLQSIDISMCKELNQLDVSENNLSVVILPDSLKSNHESDNHLNFKDNPLDLNYKVYFSDTSFSKYGLAQEVSVRNGFNVVFKRGEIGYYYNDSNNLMTEYYKYEKYYTGKQEDSTFSYLNGKLTRLSRTSCLGSDRYVSKEEFYQTGQKKSYNFYFNHYKQGKNYSYFENGKINTETNYEEGKKHGVSKEFYPSGLLAKKSKYKNDKLKKEKRWLENGEVNKN